MSADRLRGESENQQENDKNQLKLEGSNNMEFQQQKKERLTPLNGIRTTYQLKVCDALNAPSTAS